MANITVNTNTVDVTVSPSNTANLVVSTTQSNVIVADGGILSNAEVRALFSVSNAGGDGSLTYNSLTGVFTYTGPTSANYRGAIAVSDLGGDGSLSYDSGTGIITYRGVTAAETRAHFSVTQTGGLGALNYNSTTGVFAYTTVTPDQIRAQLSNVAPLLYDQANGILSIDESAIFSGKTTDDLAQGTTNLYYSNALVDAYINDSITTTDITEGDNLYFTTDRANTATVAYFADAVNGPFSINGNLNVAGNLNYENVTDLYVTDQKITLNANATTNDSVEIIANRPIGNSTSLRWNEGGQYWQFTNDGTVYHKMATDTDDLDEGSTNLYYTDNRVVTAINDNEVTLKFYHETEGPFQSATSGNLTVDFADGTTSMIVLNGDVTGITLANTNVTIGSGEVSTYSILFQNQFGNEALDTTTYPGNWTNWRFVDNDTQLATGSGQFTLLTVTADINDIIVASLTRFQTPPAISNSGLANSNIIVNGTTIELGSSGDISNFGSLTTDDLTEGTNNKYWSTSGNAVSTTYLVEGTNLYYTTDRANSAIGAYQGDINTAGNITADYFFANEEFIGDIEGAISEKVYNNSGAVLPKGAAVYVNGAQGDQPNVALANSELASHMPAMGIVKEQIGINGTGQVVIAGTMNFAGHGFPLGSSLWVNGAGVLTDTRPTGENNLIQKIAKVIGSNQILVQGAGRSNETPNLNEGNIFLGGTDNCSRTVTPSTNFVTTGNVFELSNTLTNVNTITTEDGTGFTVNSRDGIVFKQEFSLTDTEVANISGDGFAFRNNNLYSNQLSYSGANAIVAYKFNGNITSGSNEITISAVNRYQDDAASSVSDLVAGMVYAEGTNFGSQPKGFARTAYVQSVDSANSKVIMSEVAQATLSVTDSTFWNAMVDTSTGQVVQIRSDYDNSGGSNTSVNNGLPINPDAYGYPSTGFSATDFDVISVGTASDYSWDANIANFMVGRTAFAAEGTAPKFINGLVVGENTSLTNRAENDNLESFGVNVMWDGVSTAGYTSKIPQILLKSYTDNTLATVNNAINQSQKSLAGPRLFFSSADGNANDYAFGTYPKVNQELGRIVWWGSNAQSLTPSSTYPPALISVLPHDNWETAGDSALDPAGNADMYFASTVDNTQGADVFMSYQGGKLTLASGKRADENRHGIYFAPAEQNKKLMPKAIGLTYYEGNSKYWTKIGPANIAGDEGSQLTITNGGDRGTTVGDLKVSIHRQNDPNVEFSVHGLFDAALVQGAPGYGKIAMTVPDEVSSYFSNGGLITLSGTFEESATGNENALSGNTYRMFFATNVGGDIGYDIYLLYTTGYSQLTYASIGGSTPYPNSAPQVNYVDAPRVSFTNTQSGYSDKEWTLELNYPSDELNLKVDNNQVIEFSNVSTTFTNIPVMPSYSNTALPSSIAGGQIYITNGNNKPAYGDGTNWYYFDNTQVT